MRKELRRVPDEEREPLKRKISAISAEMKELRKEISLCESIADSSQIIEPKLQQIHAEEIEERKEKKAYEPWR